MNLRSDIQHQRSGGQRCDPSRDKARDWHRRHCGWCAVRRNKGQDGAETRCRLVLVFVLLAAMSLMAAPASPEFKGSGLCQFALHGFALSPQSEATINQSVQKLLEQHQAAFGFVRRPDFRLRMRVFNRFEDFTNAPAVRAQTNLQGVYVPANREIITWRQEIPGFLGTTLLHEASHAIMHAHYRRAPLWLLEGAAEYFSYASSGRNDLNARLLRKRWALLNYWLREDKLPPLTTVLNAHDEEWNRMDSDQAYAVSWSLFQSLMSSETNRQVLKRILNEWQEPGSARLDGTAQFQRLYPGGLEGLIRAWHRWIDRTGAARTYKVPWKGSGLCRFALHGYELPVPLETTLNRQTQALLEKHRAALGGERPPDQPLRIRIFGQFQDYVRFTTNWMVSGWEVTAARLDETAGYYTPLGKEIVTWSAESQDQLARRVLPLAHDALLHESFPKVPGWIRIGSLHSMVTDRQLGADERAALAAAWQRAGLDARRLPPWRTLMQDSLTRSEAEAIGSLNQTEVMCWALFQFLNSSEQNRRVLRALLEAPPGSPVASGDGASRLERLYPGGGKRFEADFKQWLSREELR